MVLILHSKTSSKKLGDCKFHLLSPSLENEELSFLSFNMTGKAYQKGDLGCLNISPLGNVNVTVLGR